MESTQILECTQVLDCYPTVGDTRENPVKVGKLTVGGIDYFIWSKENTIGRDIKCDIVIDSKAVSVEHAIIEADIYGGHFICDLGSTNKTKIGDMQLKPRVKYFINNGASLRIANVNAVYHHLNLTEQTSNCSAIPESVTEIPGTPEKNEEPLDSIITETPGKIDVISDTDGSDGDLFGETPSVSSLFLKPIGLVDSSYEASYNNLLTKIDDSCGSAVNTSVAKVVKGTSKDFTDESTYPETDASGFVPSSQQMFTPFKHLPTVYDVDAEPLIDFKAEESCKDTTNNRQWDDIDDSLSQISNQMDTIDSLVERDCLKVTYTPPKRMPLENKTEVDSAKNKCSLTKEFKEAISTCGTDCEKNLNNLIPAVDNVINEKRTESNSGTIPEVSILEGNLTKNPQIPGIYDCDTQKFEMELQEDSDDQSRINRLVCGAQEETSVFDVDTQPMSLYNSPHNNSDDIDAFDRVHIPKSVDSPEAGSSGQIGNSNVSQIVAQGYDDAGTSVEQLQESTIDVSFSDLPTQATKLLNNFEVANPNPNTCRVTNGKESKLNDDSALEKKPSTVENCQLENEENHVNIKSDMPILALAETNEQISPTSNACAKNDNTIYNASLLTAQEMTNFGSVPTSDSVFDLETQILPLPENTSHSLGSGLNVEKAAAVCDTSFPDLAMQPPSKQVLAVTNSKVLSASGDCDISFSDLATQVTPEQQLSTITNSKVRGASGESDVSFSELVMQFPCEQQLSTSTNIEVCGASGNCNVSFSDLATQVTSEQQLSTITNLKVCGAPGESDVSFSDLATQVANEQNIRAISPEDGDMSISDLATQVVLDQKLGTITNTNLCNITRACDISDLPLKIPPKPKDTIGEADDPEVSVSDLATQGLPELKLKSITTENLNDSSEHCDVSVSDLGTQADSEPKVTTVGEVEDNDVSVFDLETQIISEPHSNTGSSSSSSKLGGMLKSSEASVSKDTLQPISAQIFKNNDISSSLNLDPDVDSAKTVSASETVGSPMPALGLGEIAPISKVLGTPKGSDISFSDLPTQTYVEVEPANEDALSANVKDHIDHSKLETQSKSNDESEEIYNVMTQLPIGKGKSWREDKTGDVNEELEKCDLLIQGQCKNKSDSLLTISHVTECASNIKDSLDIYSMDTVPITASSSNSLKYSPMEVDDPVLSPKNIEKSSVKNELKDVQAPQAKETDHVSAIDKNNDCQSFLPKNIKQMFAKDGHKDVHAPQVKESEEGSATDVNSGCQSVLAQDIEDSSTKDENVDVHPPQAKETEKESAIDENSDCQSLLTQEIGESFVKCENIDVCPPQVKATEKGSTKDGNKDGQSSLDKETDEDLTKDKKEISHPPLPSDICTQSLETRIGALSYNNINSQPLTKSLQSIGRKPSLADLLETLEGSQSPYKPIRKKPKPIAYSDSEDFDSPLLVPKKIRRPLSDYEDDSPPEVKDISSDTSGGPDNSKVGRNRNESEVSESIEFMANTTAKGSQKTEENNTALNKCQLTNVAANTVEKAVKDGVALESSDLQENGGPLQKTNKLEEVGKPNPVISQMTKVRPTTSNELKSHNTLNESKLSINEPEDRSFKLEISSESCLSARVDDAKTPPCTPEVNINRQKEMSPELIVVRKSSDGLFSDKPLRQYTNTKRFSLSSFTPTKEPRASSTPLSDNNCSSVVEKEETLMTKNEPRTSAEVKVSGKTPKNAKKFKKSSPLQRSTALVSNLLLNDNDLTDSQEFDSQELGRGKRKKVKKSFFDPVETSLPAKLSHLCRRGTTSSDTPSPMTKVKENCDPSDNLSSQMPQATSDSQTDISQSGIEMTKSRPLRSCPSSPRKSKAADEKRSFSRLRSNISSSEKSEAPKELKEQDSIGNEKMTNIVTLRSEVSKNPDVSPPDVKRTPKRKMYKNDGKSDSKEGPVEEKRKRKLISSPESNERPNLSSQKTTMPSSGAELSQSTIEGGVVSLDPANVLPGSETTPELKSEKKIAARKKDVPAKVTIKTRKRGQHIENVDLDKSDESPHVFEIDVQTSKEVASSANIEQVTASQKRRGRTCKSPAHSTITNIIQSAVRTTRRSKKNESQSENVSTVDDLLPQSGLTAQPTLQEKEDNVAAVPVRGKARKRRHISPVALESLSDNKDNTSQRLDDSEQVNVVPLSAETISKKGFKKQAVGTSQSFSSNRELRASRNRQGAANNVDKKPSLANDSKDIAEYLDPRVLVSRSRRGIAKSLEASQLSEASQGITDESQSLDNSLERRSTRKRKKKETFDEIASRKEEEAKLKKMKESESLSESSCLKQKDHLSSIAWSSVPFKKRRMKKDISSTSLDELDSNLSISSPSSSSGTTVERQISQPSTLTPSHQTKNIQSQMNLTLSGDVKVMFTGLADSKLESMVKGLGGKIVARPQNCSILVTDKVRRTVKFLCALGLGKPIVTPNWLSKSKAFGTYTDPTASLLKDEEAEKKFQFSLVDSLEKSRRTKLLEGFSFYVTPSVLPPPIEMKPIVECSGGTYIAKPPSKWPLKSVVISSSSDKSEWPKLKKQGIQPPIISAEAILSGILRQNFDVNKHSLK